MLMSHMESKGQRWPNVELGDVSAAFSYGISEVMMNNLWVNDFNMFEESQNHQFSGFPVQESSEYAIYDPAISSKFSVDIQHDQENDDPNSIKITELVDSKATQKSIINCENDDPNSIKITETVTQKSTKGPRTKRCKRTVFKNQWNFTSTPSTDVNGSVDNHGSAISKRSSGKLDLDEPTFKNQTGQNLVSESISVGRWLEDMGFGRYSEMFEVHEVDDEALPLLTLDDLKEIGVLAVGSRRKLYAAICQLKSESPTC